MKFLKVVKTTIGAIIKDPDTVQDNNLWHISLPENLLFVATNTQGEIFIVTIEEGDKPKQAGNA